MDIWGSFAIVSLALSLSFSLWLYSYTQRKRQRERQRHTTNPTMVTTRYPPIADCLKGLSLGLYRTDGTFHIVQEVFWKHGVMYCVENRELICVNSLIVSYNGTKRPRWIDYVYVAGFVPMPVKEYLENALCVRMY